MMHFIKRAFLSIMLLALIGAGDMPRENIFAQFPPVNPSDPKLLNRIYGSATISPDDAVIVGHYGTWTLTYTAGDAGLDDGASIWFSVKSISDWGWFQTRDAQAPDYALVETTGKAKVSSRMAFGPVRPWGKSIVVRITEGYLEPGDQVRVTIGDRSGGSLGNRIQTMTQDEAVFQVSVDPFRVGRPFPLPNPPALKVEADASQKLVLVSQSITSPQEPFWLTVRTEDKWGNLVTDFRGKIIFNTEDEIIGLPETYAFAKADRGVHRFNNLSARDAGVHRISAYFIAADGQPVTAESNPLLVSEKELNRIYWGDTQGQSEETVGTKPVEEYVWFAKHAAALDWFMHQGNDFEITPEFWERLRQQNRLSSEEGRFIFYLGYEWSGNTAVGGDHTTFFYDDSAVMHRSGHWLIDDKIQQPTDAMHVKALYKALQDKKAMLIPHIGGRRANTEFHNPKLERLIEVYSDWGYFPWFIDDVLKKGWKIGFAGASDDHRGQPGASSPGAEGFAVYGGLTGVFSPRLSRADIWSALYDRRTYATTGQRILLWVDADGHDMGEEFEANLPPLFKVRAIGTAPIERIEVKRLTDIVHTHWVDAENAEDVTRIKIVWSGAKTKDRSKKLKWDGSLSLSQGEIVEATPFAFDSPVETITKESRKRLSWRSSTAGDSDGVIVEMRGADEAILRLDTPVLPVEISVASLNEAPQIFPQGDADLGRQIALYTYAKGDRSHDVSFEFMDADLPEGVTPYYVVVYQEDGGMALSSPVYVTKRQ